MNKKTKKNRTSTQRVGDFLEELQALYRKHGFALSHEDGHGNFIVEKIAPYLCEWVSQATIGESIDASDKQS